jgi:hypothetical protein
MLAGLFSTSLKEVVNKAAVIRRTSEGMRRFRRSKASCLAERASSFGHWLNAVGARFWTHEIAFWFFKKRK